MNLAKISSENENLLQETSSHKDMKNELLTLMGKAEQLDEKVCFIQDIASVHLKREIAADTTFSCLYTRS